MYGGDYARKKTLVEYGFRLPSAFDNRPLKFEEVESKLNQMVFVSATPGEYERRNSTRIAQQVIRPTGLLDPLISVRPVEGQVTDLLGEINARTAKNERVLVTTLTKKMAEDLTDFLTEQGIKVGICTTRWTLLSAWRSSGICAWAPSMWWWASTSCVRAWICPRSALWRSWMPTRKASCAVRPPHPDHWPRGPQRRGPGHYVRR